MLIIIIYDILRAYGFNLILFVNVFRNVTISYVKCYDFCSVLSVYIYMYEIIMKIRIVYTYSMCMCYLNSKLYVEYAYLKNLVHYIIIYYNI